MTMEADVGRLKGQMEGVNNSIIRLEGDFRRLETKTDGQTTIIMSVEKKIDGLISEKAGAARTMTMLITLATAFSAIITFFLSKFFDRLF